MLSESQSDGNNAIYLQTKAIIMGSVLKIGFIGRTLIEALHQPIRLFQLHIPVTLRNPHHDDGRITEVRQIHLETHDGFTWFNNPASTKNGY